MKKSFSKTDNILLNILKIEFVFENLSARNAKLGDSIVSYRNFKEYILQTAELEMRILGDCYEKSSVARMADALKAPFEKSLPEKDLDDFADDVEMALFKYGKALTYDETYRFEKIVNELLKVDIDESEQTNIIFKIKEYRDLISEFKNTDFLFVEIKKSFHIFSNLVELYNKNYLKMHEKADLITPLYRLFYPNTNMSIFAWDRNRIKLKKLVQTYNHMLNYSMANPNSELPDEFNDFILETQDQIGQIFGYGSQYYLSFKDLPFYNVFRGLDEIVKFQPFREAISILKKIIKEFGELNMEKPREKAEIEKNKVEIGSIGDNAQLQIQTEGKNIQKMMSNTNIDKTLISDLIKTLLSSDSKLLDKVKVLEKADSELSKVVNRDYEPAIIEEIGNLDKSSKSKLKTVFDELINFGLAVESSIIGSIIFNALFN